MPLDVGSVFRVWDISLGEEPHRHVVVHKIDDDSIVTAYFSTKLENLKRRCRRDEMDPPLEGPRTYVEVGISDCPQGLTELCAVNCNALKVRSITECEGDWDFNDFDGAILSRPKLDLIREGITHSRTVSEEIKDYFR